MNLSPILAQQKIEMKGNIEDTNGEALAFVNIALLHGKDSSLITGTISDSKGHFTLAQTLEKGAYWLQFSSVGHKKQYRSIKVEDSHTILIGLTILEEDAETLEGVTVKSMRPLIQVESDKMVVSVENTALAEGNTTFEVLGRTPGVFIDQDGNIQLNGRPGVLVTIDDRQTYLSASELQTLLESIPASNLKNIELITNPSSKYDAEGVAGIININLKKNAIVGFNGSVYGGYQYNRYHAYLGGLNLNYKKNRLSTFINLDYTKRNTFRDNEINRQFSQNGTAIEMAQSGEWRFIYDIPSVKAGLEYEITDNHSVGLKVNSTFLEGTEDFSILSRFTEGQQDPTFIDSRNFVDKGFTNITSNLHYVGKLDTAGRKISADLDYANMSRYNFLNFRNLYFSNEMVQTQREDLFNDNPVNYDILAFRTDYVHPFSDDKQLEVGVKASRVVSDNEIVFERLDGESWQAVPELSNHFIYTENITAAYFNYSTSLGERWNFKGGLRAEHTRADGFSVTLDSANLRSYLDFFPSAFLQQKVTDDYQITYSYSRRINRPNYESLNPFVLYLDPFTISAGNPNLDPSYAQNIELSQTFFNNYTLAMGYTLTRGLIQEAPLFNEETNQTIFQVNNFDRNQSANLRLIVPIEITKWWQMMNVSVISYNEVFASFMGDVIEEDIFNFNIQSSHTLLLPWDIRMELNATYISPMLYGPYRAEKLWWVDAGFKRSFLDKKVEVSLNATDIFMTRRFIGGTEFQNQVAQFNQYNAFQSLRLTLRYRFSQGMKFEAPSKNGNLEEIRRTGGN